MSSRRNFSSSRVSSQAVQRAALFLAFLPCAVTFSFCAASFQNDAKRNYGVAFAVRLPARGKDPRFVAVGAGLRDKDFARSLETAEALVLGLRSRTAQDDNSALNLETDFFDPSTGLHSEGVWHNALIGIACVGLTASGCAVQDLRGAPRRIAASLLKHSWDGASFRRRAHSGRWDHSTLSDSSSTVEQPAYYGASDEHRCVQHGMCCVFWSFLREMEPDVAQEYNMIAAAFVDQFWDQQAAHWTTISRTQGVATGARRSASTGQSGPPKGANSAGGQGLFEEVGGVNQVYFRAVDHAIALVALVSMVYMYNLASLLQQRA